ncbi:MAG: ABC transporter ATP-binding protein [Rhodospirillaceae bacterium]|nr:ABC transporter ATP-binding protein [Rhodospirillaceae bacterium]|tara:strand:- start:4331 stop:5077 length:747 start_codon:yes stop_codon:yes gene_type:complete
MNNNQNIELLKCEGINKWYGNLHALKDVNMSINKGEVIGLIGDNGAGKSTLIKIICGVHKLDKGSVHFEGNKVSIENPKAAMKLGIETIHQYSTMFQEMSIARNVFIGREPKKFGLNFLGLLDEKIMDHESMKAIKDVGLDLRSPHIPVKELSGGERQGVAIARSMFFKSKMLILDEPTNHLSVKETLKVLEYIQSLKNLGIGSIFISHNLYHVHEVSDRIVGMARGEKVCDLNKDETTVNDLIKLIG